MSTRWYPIYQRGNPQLRVFLPNFWMKLVRPTEEQPANVVTFAVSTEMTKHDVKNYLEKIYKLPVVDVRTRIALGETKRDQTYGYVTKKDDVKYAYVTMVSEDYLETAAGHDTIVSFSFFFSRKPKLLPFRIYL